MIWKKELYNGNKIIWDGMQADDKAKGYLGQVPNSLYDDGLKFLDDFMKRK